MSNTENESRISIRFCSIYWSVLFAKAHLPHDKVNHELISEQAGLAFPVRDGIPIMLVDEARKLDLDK